MIRFITGDLTNQPDLDVIVNAANRSLRAGGGVCGAIFRAAGTELRDSCLEYPVLYTVEGDDVVDRPVRCPTGGAVATPAHQLPNKAIIHAVGPIWGAHPPEEAHALLRTAYRSSLDVATTHRLKTIGFPAISCGIYGYPLAQASSIAISAVTSWLEANPDTITEVRFVFLPFGDGPEVLSHFRIAADRHGLAVAE